MKLIRTACFFLVFHCFLQVAASAAPSVAEQLKLITFIQQSLGTHSCINKVKTYLINEGFRPNDMNDEVMWTDGIYITPLKAAIEMAQPFMVSLLLSQNADPNYMGSAEKQVFHFKNYNKVTPLGVCLMGWEKKPATMKEIAILLLNAKASVDQFNPLFGTPFIQAIDLKNVEAVDLMLKFTSNLNQTYSYFPMCYLGTSVGCCWYLREPQSDDSDQDQSVTLYPWIKMGGCDGIQSCLSASCPKLRGAQIAPCKECWGESQPDHVTNGLLQAIKSKNLEMVDLLVKNGADVNVVPDLFFIGWSDHLGILKKLLDANLDLRRTLRSGLSVSETVLQSSHCPQEIRDYIKSVM